MTHDYSILNSLGHIVIDTTGATTDLCTLGAHFGTDKSPYSKTTHRHPYTAVYDLLFSFKRWDEIVLGEVGVLDNMSMHMWREYFPNAQLFGFEVFQDKIFNAETHKLPRVKYFQADVNDKDSLFRALNQTGKYFDILIDDSTHLFDHQTNFAESAVDFLKPGGLLIIEDVFRGWNEELYNDSLRHLFPYFSSGSFLETNHAHAFSEGGVEPYYNNDKLLVFTRNDRKRKRFPLKA